MNYAVNRILERKAVFADLLNGILFDGNEIIHAETLEMLSPNSGKIYKSDKGKTSVIERRGDVRMRANEEVFSIIVAVEPQDMVHYAMPIRVYGVCSTGV